MSGPYLTDMPFSPSNGYVSPSYTPDCGHPTIKPKTRKPKRPKQWVADWMGKHDLVLSDRAYKALVRKLKRAAKESSDAP